jgi:hypothetical protein
VGPPSCVAREGLKMPHRWAKMGWQQWQLDLLGTAPDAELAARFGRTVTVVRMMRGWGDGSKHDCAAVELLPLARRVHIVYLGHLSWGDIACFRHTRRTMPASSTTPGTT